MSNPKFGEINLINNKTINMIFGGQMSALGVPIR